MTANQFKEARERLGVAQEELAHMLGISVRSIARYEKGTYLVPKAVELALRYRVSTQRRQT